MKTYAMVRNAAVVSHFATDRPITDFPDIQQYLIEAPANVQDGWEYNGSTFSAHAPTVEELRLSEIDTDIQSNTLIATIKPMSKAQFDAWWSGLTAGAKVEIVRWVVFFIVRRFF